MEGLSPHRRAGCWYPSLEWHLQGPAGGAGWGSVTQAGHFMLRNPLCTVLMGFPGTLLTVHRKVISGQIFLPLLKFCCFSSPITVIVFYIHVWVEARVRKISTLFPNNGAVFFFCMMTPAFQPVCHASLLAVAHGWCSAEAGKYPQWIRVVMQCRTWSKIPF